MCIRDRSYCFRKRDFERQASAEETLSLIHICAGKKKNTKDVDMVKKMFEEIAPKYANRNGGYTRIVKIGQRKGDGAMEVLIELV